VHNKIIYYLDAPNETVCVLGRQRGKIVYEKADVAQEL